MSDLVNCVFYLYFACFKNAWYTTVDKYGLDLAYYFWNLKAWRNTEYPIENARVRLFRIRKLTGERSERVSLSQCSCRAENIFTCTIQIYKKHKLIILPSFENSDYCFLWTRWNELIKTRRIKSKPSFGYDFRKRAILFNCCPCIPVRSFITREILSFTLLIGRTMFFPWSNFIVRASYWLNSESVRFLAEFRRARRAGERSPIPLEIGET